MKSILMFSLFIFVSSLAFAETPLQKRERLKKELEQTDAEIKAQQEDQKKKLRNTAVWLREEAAGAANKAKEVLKQGAEVVGKPIKEGMEVMAKAQDEKERREDTKNYDPSTCKWTNEIPRRIIKAPSCGRTPMNICTGYVVCDQKAPNTGKFIRMTVCSSDLCGDEDAVACTEDQGYSSVKPDGVESNTVSGGVRKIIQSGASKQ